MTEIVTTSGGIPVISADPFSQENLIDPRPLQAQLREAGPVVYVKPYGVWALARYEQVNAVLKDWRTFSSASGEGLSNFHEEEPWRVPSILLEADPPSHTYAREVVGLSAPRHSRRCDQISNARLSRWWINCSAYAHLSSDLQKAVGHPIQGPSCHLVSYF
jgi:cytochrome P450